jgi:thioesterase domain-containing protein
VCVPPFIGRPGAQQFARFAAAFRDDRDVFVLTQPGFAAGQRVPADVAAVAEVLADVVRQHATGPFVLVGHSSGGLVANALAGRLEQLGRGPVGLVLIDVYPSEENPAAEVLPGLMPAVLARQQARSDGDTWLTAMGRYLDLDWTPSDVAAPTLLLRATERLAGWSGTAADWRSAWKHADSVADVPGDHFTVLEDHAATTARAVAQWPPAPQAG